MIFVVKSSSKPYWGFKNNIKLIEKKYISKNVIYIEIYVFYFNQFVHNLSNFFFKNLILIRFKGIEANYLYVYQTNFIKKIIHMNCFNFIAIWNFMK
jgi:hypothetical protein